MKSSDIAKTKAKRKVYDKRYRRKNRRKIAIVRKIYEKKNRTKHLANRKKYRRRNRDKFRKRDREYSKANKELRASQSAKRRAFKLQATPTWANDRIIKAFYLISGMLTKLTGIKHHVDHIIPLNNKLVCGFHVEHNLRVLTAKENMAKSNRFWPDMP